MALKTDDPPGNRHLGDFEIVREIGRGGMGIVYEARQVSLNRRVALKVLSGGLGLKPTTVQRFRREAEAAARLHHTNVVPVYVTGEEAGTHFYAMELIDGPSLDQVLRQMRAGPGIIGQTFTSSEGAGDLSSDLARTGTYVEDTSTSDPDVERASTAGATNGLSSASLGSGSSY